MSEQGQWLWFSSASLRDPGDHPTPRPCFSNRGLFGLSHLQEPYCLDLLSNEQHPDEDRDYIPPPHKPEPSQLPVPSRPSCQLTWHLALWLGHRGPVPLSVLDSAGGFLNELLPQAQKLRKPPGLLLPLGLQDGLQVSEGLSGNSLGILEDTEVPFRDGLPSSFPRPLTPAAGLGVAGIRAGASGRDELSIRAGRAGC